MESVRVALGPTDGATGHSIATIGFTNMGDEPCSLSEPIGVVTIPDTGPVERGGFFGLDPVPGFVEPGESLSVAIESSHACEAAQQGATRLVGVVEIEFADGTSRDIELILDAVCGLAWQGFVEWR